MTYSQTLETLLNRQDLNYDAMLAVMSQVMAGELTHAQIAGFMIALRAKGETRLENFLSREVGASRAVLVETPSQGRTEHFALAKFETAMVPGAVVQTRVQSATAAHLHVGM